MAKSPPLEEQDPPRLAVVAVDPLVREGFSAMLAERGLEVVDDESVADVVLVDTGADPERALSVLAEVEAVDVPILALLADDAHLEGALDAGAKGAVLRSAEADRILAAILAVRHGLTVVDGPLERPSPPVDDDLEDLTSREREVLELLADGLSNRRIAKRLEISEHTAKFHIASILGKLDARTRTEAVVIAVRRGLLLL
jgi:DNA-binding NarL/FixJ family response regulator